MINNSLLSLLQVQVLQVSILILLAGSITWFLKNRHPHIACALWLVVFVKCLTPPVMSTPFGLFAWQSAPELHQGNHSEVVVNSPQKVLVEGKTKSRGIGTEVAGVSANPVASGRVSASSGSPSLAADPVRPGTKSGHSAGGLSATVYPTALAKKTLRNSGSLVAVLAWLGGAALILVIATGQWIRCWKIIQATRVATDDRLRRVVEQVKQKLGYHRDVRIVVTDSEYGPMVFGYFRPVLIFPKQIIVENASSELESLVAHELIHVRRGDTLMSLLQFLSITIGWFNPLIWWANRQANLVCERCCDLEVVDGLQCKPTRYARTLLGVVESRQTYRAIVAAAGIRPAEVTTQRLEWLASQQLRSRRCSQRIGWVASVVVALLVFPAAGIGAPQEEPKLPSVTPQLVEANDFANANIALRRQNWELSAELFQKVLDESPDNAVAWFRMGYALHALGRLDEAIVAHEKATEYPNTRRTGFYNWACALCLMGDHDGAIEKLTKALDAGFALPTQIDQDPDFATLLDDERFQALAKRHLEIVKSQPPGSRGAGGPGLAQSDPSGTNQTWNQLNFLIGEWSVTSSEGKPVGTSTVTRQEKGHMIHEVFTGLSGMTGQSFSYFNAGDKLWVQNRVDSTGRVINLNGAVNDKTIEMTGLATLKIGSQAKCRMKVAQLDDGRLRQTVEISKDQGETWEKTFDGFFARTQNRGAESDTQVDETRGENNER